MAVGAGRGDILWMIIGEGVLLAAGGILAGAAGARFGAVPLLSAGIGRTGLGR
jgi:ABC-type antimicrobial peptide transport system permease subunit